MALVSPGVEVTIIDQSQYIPAATNSVPYILLATASNKISGSGVGIAAGTLTANANRVYLITSQRDLAATYGVPFFYQTTAGTPINGYELNEYGLLAAYSALGISNRCYVQRVDIDLAELTATLVRPTGNPTNNTYWLDTASTRWGIFQWNQTTAAFTNQLPIVITDTADLEDSSTVPLQTIGSIGNYAVTATNIYNPIYYKRGGPTASQTTATELSNYYNTWVLVGSDDWKTSWATIQGTLAPTSLTAGNTVIINGTTVAVPAGPNNTVTGLSAAINTAAITGVYSAVIGGKLSLYANSTATSDGSTAGEGLIHINNGTGTPLTTLGITANTYAAPDYFAGYSYQAPRWAVGQAQPEPTGSVWLKINNVNLGTNLSVKKFNSTLGTFVLQKCPVYFNDSAANYGLDPSGGGQYIAAGATYAQCDPTPNDGMTPITAGFLVLERYATGSTIITGNLTFTSTATPFTPSDTFTISASSAGSSTMSSPVTATIGGTGTISDFVSAVSAADVPYVSASVNSAGNLVFTHSQGGSILLTNVVGTPVTDAGFNTTVRGCRPALEIGTLELSNWVTTPTFTYTASDNAPNQDPADGRLWYYSAATNNADIMIQNNGAWMGYQMVTNDVRGENLTLTNASGPIFSTTAPMTQNNESSSPLVYGDLWINTSDLENYPVISRWTNVSGVAQWVQLDNTDQTTSNGILFEDARWAPNGTTNPVTDPFPTIASLLVSDYLDLDAPDPALYPQGMLLFNTRRSGFNVKSFQADYFNATTFPDSSLPDQTNAWVTASGNRNDGSPYMGRQAQRALIVQALKAGIDTSTQIREEINQFNLIACPQYPELAPNMVALNNERGDTAFTVVDTPLRLTPQEIVTWATNNSGLGIATGDGLLVGDAYAGAFYPSCQTTDLSGNPVVQPPSHMMIRTIIRSDEVAYPWLAPAGTRRGVIDNAALIGYVNAITGEFTTLGVNQGLRDVLYTNRVNPITFIPGVGITNFGNKTTTSLASALDRINVARLVAFVRGRLNSIAKQYLFEPNDQITRDSIQSACTSLMIDLVAKRGIYDYLVVCDLSNNTPTTIDRNELYVDIAIEPVKAVEFIYIPVRIQNTGTIANATTI
jgi:Phage tail sheath C-terminal domain